MKPVYVVAASRSQMSGWHIADEAGVLKTGLPVFRDRATCAVAIAGLNT